MIADKFLVGVGTGDAFDSNNNLLFTSKSYTDNTINISASNKVVNYGKGNMQAYIYYHTSKMAVSLTEAQFNLQMLGAAMGVDIQTGENIWEEEIITLGAGGTGTVSQTPMVSPDATTTIYGWIQKEDGTQDRVTFTGKNFTVSGGQSGDQVNIKYYRHDTAVESITVPANIIPKIVRYVMKVEEASNKAGSGIIGRVEVEIPQLQLDPTVALSLKSSDVSNLPLKANALSYSDSAFGEKYYAKIKEIITDAKWYDNVTILASTVDPITLSGTTTTAQLDIRAITNDRRVIYLYPDCYPDLTFTSSASGVVTCSNTGLITKVASGNAIINVKITNKDTIQTDIDVTVS